MKYTKFLIAVIFSGILFSSCTKEDVAPRNFEVENFIWAGLNEIYLYKSDVPELGDFFFTTAADKEEYFKDFETPEDVFESLLSSKDKFSFIVDDYIELENLFSGISKTDGMALGLIKYDTDKVLAYVQYILPNTPAEEAGIKRGDAFTKVNGVTMNMKNYSELLGKDSYEIELAYLQNNTIMPADEKVTLTKEVYSENPVFMVKTFPVNGRNIGYLMYNSFTFDFNAELNAAFAELKSQNVTDLILDLRYNGGGSVATAVSLAGMITGQYKGEVFLKEQWNERYQQAWEPESYLYRFTDKIPLSENTEETINSLGLDKVYVLTTSNTASASELIINGLEPYIDVIQIGSTTTGKFQASVTLYDSPNFGRKNANPNHTYALQPLVFKSANSEGVSDYHDGLRPDIEIFEDLGNLGVLGDPNELYLNAALNHIKGASQEAAAIEKARELSQKFKVFGQSGFDSPLYQEMYINELPFQRH